MGAHAQLVCCCISRAGARSTADTIGSAPSAPALALLHRTRSTTLHALRSPLTQPHPQQQTAMALFRPLQASLPTLLQRWGAALHTSTSLRGLEELIVLPPKEDEKEPTTGPLRLGSCSRRRCRRRRRLPPLGRQCSA